MDDHFLEVIRAPFVAKLTASTLSSGTYFYDWTEQAFDPVSGTYQDATPPRSGTGSTNPKVAPAVEVNNSNVSTPTYVWLKLRGMVSGTPWYEFQSQTAAGASIYMQTFAVDYTDFTGFTGLSTGTINLLNPLPSNYCGMQIGYRIASGKEFTGGTISSSGATPTLAASAFGPWQWTTKPTPDSFTQAAILTANCLGVTSDKLTLTLQVTNDTLDHLTNGHATVHIVYAVLP